jgi:hypothetical protein
MAVLKIIVTVSSMIPPGATEIPYKPQNWGDIVFLHNGKKGRESWKIYQLCFAYS